MNIQQAHQIFRGKQGLNLFIAICITLFISVNVMLDFIFTFFQNSSFYISESLLFSSYWLIFLPLLTFALQLDGETERWGSRLFLICFTIAFHLLSYPALVWLLSRLFFQHTFAYWQTFNFGLSAYLIKTDIIYGFSFVSLAFWKKRSLSSQVRRTVDKKIEGHGPISSMLVSGNNNQKQLLQLNDILYFSANSPYINIYHVSKKYLHTQTLKSLEDQLNDQQFVRIHKSCIVNINKISAIQSRQNGDHDLRLLDGTTLRLSRNYAKRFKSIFFRHHHHATK